MRQKFSSSFAWFPTIIAKKKTIVWLSSCPVRRNNMYTLLRPYWLRRQSWIALEANSSRKHFWRKHMNKTLLEETFEENASGRNIKRKRFWRKHSKKNTRKHFKKKDTRKHWKSTVAEKISRKLSTQPICIAQNIDTVLGIRRWKMKTKGQKIAGKNRV